MEFGDCGSLTKVSLYLNWSFIIFLRGEVYNPDIQVVEESKYDPGLSFFKEYNIWRFLSQMVPLVCCCVILGVYN